MIQELFGGAAATAGLIGSSITGERKISIADGLILHPSSDSFPLSFPSVITTTATTTATKANTSLTATTTTPTTSNSEVQNLKCPRCNSANTKFCYYNNYNLTQPRHFCKACSRYWTKGGTLRNIPIGGGCRKNKITSCSSSCTTGKSSATKVKMTLPLTDFGWPGMDGRGLDLNPSSSQMFWPSLQVSHVMPLLRAARSPNPIPNLSNAFAIKREGLMMGSDDTGMPSPLSVGSGGSESYDNKVISSIGFCSSFMKNGQFQQHHQQQLKGLVHEAAQSSSVQLSPLSSAICGLGVHTSASVLCSNSVSTPSFSATSSAIFESSPVVLGGGDDLLSSIDASLSWNKLPTLQGGQH